MRKMWCDSAETIHVPCRQHAVNAPSVRLCRMQRMRQLHTTWRQGNVCHFVILNNRWIVDPDSHITILLVRVQLHLQFHHGITVDISYLPFFRVFFGEVPALVPALAPGATFLFFASDWTSEFGRRLSACVRPFERGCVELLAGKPAAAVFGPCTGLA